MGDKTFLVLGVALITWGFVFFYLLRLDALARRLETEVRAAEESRAQDAERAATGRVEAERPPIAVP